MGCEVFFNVYQSLYSWGKFSSFLKNHLKSTVLLSFSVIQKNTILMFSANHVWNKLANGLYNMTLPWFLIVTRSFSFGKSSHRYQFIQKFLAPWWKYSPFTSTKHDSSFWRASYDRLVYRNTDRLDLSSVHIMFDSKIARSPFVNHVRIISYHSFINDFTSLKYSMNNASPIKIKRIQIKKYIKIEIK